MKDIFWSETYNSVLGQLLNLSPIVILGMERPWSLR